MAIKLDEAQKRRLESEQFLLSKVPSGGPRRQTYYTPDGRKIQQFPQMREYVLKDKDGNIIETGTRDANYDHGWLPSSPPPQLRKPYCPSCDKWHDDEAGVEACRKRRQAEVEAQQRKVQERLDRERAKAASSNGADARIDQIEASLAEVKGLVMELIKRLQPDASLEEEA